MSMRDKLEQSYNDFVNATGREPDELYISNDDMQALVSEMADEAPTIEGAVFKNAILLIGLSDETHFE